MPMSGRKPPANLTRAMHKTKHGTPVEVIADMGDGVLLVAAFGCSGVFTTIMLAEDLEQ